MAKKHKILGAIAGLVGVAVIATGVYFAVPKIVNKSWGEILHIGEEKPPAETSKLTLNTNGNLTFICADDKGNTYTEEELEAKEWQGETLTFTLAPNDGFMLWSTKVNGEEIELDNNMFTVTIDKDTTIDVDVQEIKEYTANIVEDRYSQWQLIVNGKPLNDGDTIHTGDLITGRVISLTSGYKTQTFLVNDVEYVHLLDKYGFIQQPIRVENTDLTTVTFATSTVRDVSSLYVPFGGSIDTKSVISSPAFTYTSETCSVYNIIYYGIRVGEEVKMDFTITNPEYFGGITLNGEPLEVTTQEDGVTASCTFIVPETECTLEVVSTFEEYSIPFEYDETQFIVSEALSSSAGSFDGKNYVVTRPVSGSFRIEISPIDSSWGTTKKILVEVDGDVIKELDSSSFLFQASIPYTAQNVSIYFEAVQDIFEPYEISVDMHELIEGHIYGGEGEPLAGLVTAEFIGEGEFLSDESVYRITTQPTSETFTVRFTNNTGHDIYAMISNSYDFNEYLTCANGESVEFEVPYSTIWTHGLSLAYEWA